MSQTLTPTPTEFGPKGGSFFKTWAENSHGFHYQGTGRGGFSDEQMKWLFRRPLLRELSAYIDNKQYTHLLPWDPNIGGEQFDTRKRQPKLIFPLPLLVAKEVADGVCGEEGRLKFTSENQEQVEKFLNETNFWAVMSSAMPSLLANGSVFVRFYVHERHTVLKIYNSANCIPKFDEARRLEEVEIRYVFDSGEKDDKGSPILKYGRFKIGRDKDIEYDNPVFDPNAKEVPKFKVQNENRHGLGVVQGEWLTTSYTDEVPDGESIIYPVRSFIDSMNYRLSKEDGSLYLNLLGFLQAAGMDANELKQQRDISKELEKEGLPNLLTTGGKPANEAKYAPVEWGISGLQLAESYNIRTLQLMQFALRIVLLDPERVASHAQSGVAMKALHQPLIKQIKALRPWLYKPIVTLLEKMGMAGAKFSAREVTPPGTFKKSEKKWGNVFSDTPMDITQKVQYTSQAKMEGIIARKTATAHLAPDFGIEDVEKELSMIEQEQQEDLEKELAMSQPPEKNGP